MPDTLDWKDTALLREVERRSGTQVSACYQCHKCSTGCPVAPDMDYTSSQVMRLVHLGADKDLLESQAIWLCASCETCTTRCPQGIDIAAVMDTLRIMSVERKATIPDARVQQFNASFLSNIRWIGRIYELGMMAMYKFRSRDFFTDVDKVPGMLAKRKLSLRPHFSKSSREVRDVFTRAEEEENKR